MKLPFVEPFYDEVGLHFIIATHFARHFVVFGGIFR